jgi:hypothetical protein
MPDTKTNEAHVQTPNRPTDQSQLVALCVVTWTVATDNINASRMAMRSYGSFNNIINKLLNATKRWTAKKGWGGRRSRGARYGSFNNLLNKLQDGLAMRCNSPIC